ncbi:MAG: O-antigen ligase family protein [Solirubrobacterales bacterium]
MPRSAVAVGGLVACGPAAFTAYLAFRSGGFFAGAPAIVAVILGVALMLRLVLAESPLEGFGPALVWAAVGLGCYALWTLLSALWSHAPAQALIEFDRALMYWLALVFFGSWGWDRERLLWMVRVLVGAMFVVAMLGLITRLLPGVHSIPTTFENYRLSYPLSYWNALGIFVAVAIVLALGLTTRREESTLGKALAAATVPLLAATLYFTFSRGAIAALFVGTVLFVVPAARRTLLSTALAIGPAALVATLASISTDALSTEHYADSTGVGEGHKLVWVLLACAAAAGVFRVLLSPLDRRLDEIEVSPRAQRRFWIGALAAAAVVVVVVGIAVDAPAKIDHGFESFTETKGINDSGRLQNRLTDLNNNGRLVQWELGLETFGRHPLLGTGAGTFARVWAQDGNGELKVLDAHSLYVQVLAELGIPGFVFLVVALAAVLIGLASRIRGPDRVLYAALFAACLMWAFHAGFDWDWEMPATGFFFFALGGAAIAARPGTKSSAPALLQGRMTRVALGIGCLVLVVSPALMAVSQGQLNASVGDLEAGDCAGASRQALDAIHTLSVRPEPYQVLGFCDSRVGRHRLAILMLKTAVARDEGEWESWYGLALVRAMAGLDPRPAARKAYELAPYEPLAVEAVQMFKTDNPHKWRRRASMARLPIP